MTASLSQPVLHEIEFRLSCGDCDPAGVHLATYYAWFERVYNEWAFLGGFAPARMMELWGASPVALASSCRYHVPGQLHDPLTCRMRLGRVGTRSFSIDLSIDHNETGETFADGEMVFDFVAEQRDGDERPRRTTVPQGLLDALAAAGCSL